MKSKIACAFVLAFAASTPVLSQEDCLPALQADVIDLTSDTQQRLIMFDQMSRNRKETEKTGISVIYQGIRFGFDHARRVSSSLNKLLQVDYSNEERNTLYVSRLSEGSVNAYIACLGKKVDISYSFAGNIIGARTFFLKVNWHPQFRPDGTAQRGTVMITQGKFIKNAKNEMEFEIRPTDSMVIGVERDEFERSQIAIIIDGKVQTIDLPPRSKYRIAIGTRKSAPYETNTRETRGDIGKTLCVELANNEYDSAIVPGSFRFVFEQRQAERVTINDKNPVTENERSACAHLGVVFDNVFKSHVHVKAHAEASVFTAIPVQTVAPATTATVPTGPNVKSP